MSYIRTQLTREEFFQKIRNKSGSEDSERSARSGIANLDYYCRDVYKKTPETVFEDLKLDIEKNGDTGKPIKFLDDFVTWLGQDHPNIVFQKTNYKPGKPKKAVRSKTKDNYVIYSRKFMKL